MRPARSQPLQRASPACALPVPAREKGGQGPSSEMVYRNHTTVLLLYCTVQNDLRLKVEGPRGSLWAKWITFWEKKVLA